MNKEQLKDLILKLLSEKNATNITCIEINGESTLADYMIFANGRSTKNISAIAKFVALELKRAMWTANVEGLKGSDWILLDAGNVIVHLFHPETREKLKLEEFWNKK